MHREIIKKLFIYYEKIRMQTSLNKAILKRINEKDVILQLKCL